MTIRQNFLVLAALKRGPLTPLEALRRLGCERLAARIHELREMGHDINRTFVRVKTRAGKVRVAKYALNR